MDTVLNGHNGSSIQQPHVEADRNQLLAPTEKKKFF